MSDIKGRGNFTSKRVGSLVGESLQIINKEKIMDSLSDLEVIQLIRNRGFVVKGRWPNIQNQMPHTHFEFDNKTQQYLNAIELAEYLLEKPFDTLIYGKIYGKGIGYGFSNNPLEVDPEIIGKQREKQLYKLLGLCGVKIPNNSSEWETFYNSIEYNEFREEAINILVGHGHRILSLTRESREIEIYERELEGKPIFEKGEVISSNTLEFDNSTGAFKTAFGFTITDIKDSKLNLGNALIPTKEYAWRCNPFHDLLK